MSKAKIEKMKHREFFENTPKMINRVDGARGDALQSGLIAGNYSAAKCDKTAYKFWIFAQKVAATKTNANIYQVPKCSCTTVIMIVTQFSLASLGALSMRESHKSN
ncbi:uncharacterized protein LOC110118540 [Ceratitis capitata]|uniref:uncharacterized protein LOC110118540 n=1 Tax=Ceratitis capitata TaxID=7213 RepID=UPI000A101F57|nr:uncharacterized protein LOC110118540 [Ceratitis capitata]